MPILRSQNDKTTRFLQAMLAAFVCIACMATASLAREWTDSTGAYKVEASLMRVENNKAILRRESGEIVAIPIARLSAADQAFLRSLGKPEVESVEEKGAARVMNEAGVFAALARPPRVLKFDNTPLKEVIEQMLGGVPYYIDARSLAKIGRNPDAPVVFETRKQASLLVNLNAMIAPAGMAVSVQHGVVVFSAREEAEAALEASVFRLSRPTDYDALIGAITSKIEPTSWDEVGGPGSIAALPPVYLVVSAPLTVKQKIAETYATKMKLLPPSTERPTPGSVEAKLSEPAKAVFLDTPLRDVARILGDAHDIELEIDTRALEAIGVGDDAPVTMRLENASLRAVLSLMLRNLDLTWVPQGDKISITTFDRAESMLEKRSYPLGPWARNPEALKQAVQLINPTDWRELGGSSSIETTARTLEVSADWATHEKIEALLNTLN